MIITQAIFEAHMFIEFLEKCSAIKIPIIPGIFVPSSYKQLQMMLSITQVPFPDKKLQMFERHANNVEDFQKFSLSYFEELIHDILGNRIRDIRIVHFFTMNDLEFTEKIVRKFEFCNYK
jgi:methylenetetrahydrofolate reductase (NADPH)